MDKSIAANRQSEFVAEPSSAHDPIRGDIVFEHAFDFIAYARLQKAQDRHVGEDLAALRESGQAMPTVDVARYALERGDWRDAAKVPVPNDVFDAVLARFTRAYGAARAGEVPQAESELAALRALRGPIAQDAGEYWAQSDDIYASVAQAWILKAQGKDAAALAMMRQAATADGRTRQAHLPREQAPADARVARRHGVRDRTSRRGARRLSGVAEALAEPLALVPRCRESCRGDWRQGFDARLFWEAAGACQ